MRNILARLCAQSAAWTRRQVVKLTLGFTAVFGVLGAVLLQSGVAGATAYTASAVVASATALGTTGNSDLIPIIFGVAGTGILVLVSLFGVRAVARVINSRRHTGNRRKLPRTGPTWASPGESWAALKASNLNLTPPTSPGPSLGRKCESPARSAALAWSATAS